MPRAVLVTLLLIPAVATKGQTPDRIPAMPLDAKAAILDAFRVHQFVALGDAHGNEQGEAFQLALIRDPRFPLVVNDILVEAGNSRYQETVDRFVRGEHVAAEALQRVWLDTTQQHVASLEPSELLNTVRRINVSLPPERRLRVLLGEPPIEWERIRTTDDLRRWEAEPLSNRDRFGLEVLRREVFAKNRRALALYRRRALFPESRQPIARHHARGVADQSVYHLDERGCRDVGHAGGCRIVGGPEPDARARHAPRTDQHRRVLWAERQGHST